MNRYGRSKAWMLFVAPLAASMVTGCNPDPIFGGPGSGGAGSGPIATSCTSGALPLGSAASFGVLGGTALTITNPTSVTGDVGSPSITPASGPSTLVGTMYDSSPAAELTVIAT